MATPGEEISADQGSGPHCGTYLPCCRRKSTMQEILLRFSSDHLVTRHFQNLSHNGGLRFTFPINQCIAHTELFATAFFKKREIGSRKEKSGGRTYRIPMSTIQVVNAVS